MARGRSQRAACYAAFAVRAVASQKMLTPSASVVTVKAANILCVVYFVIMLRP